MAYRVEPSKGDFLLFTVMNLAGYNENGSSRDFHDLRTKTRSHFAHYINDPAVLEFCKSWSVHYPQRDHPPWKTLIDLQRGVSPDDPESKRQIELLNEFKSKGNFDSFYDHTILPAYRQVCGEVEYALGEDIKNVLDGAWEFCPGFDVKIIPRPLDKPRHGDGPLIDGVAHSFIGPGTTNGIPCFRDFSLRHLVAHEVSHSYAKTIGEQVEKIISQSDSVEKVQKFARAQRARGYNGETVLEETMMRAMQARYIDPFLDIDSASPELALIKEHERYGMEHIFKFDRAIKRHKDNPKGTLAETVANLIIELA